LRDELPKPVFFKKLACIMKKELTEKFGEKFEGKGFDHFAGKFRGFEKKFLGKWKHAYRKRHFMKEKVHHKID